MHDPTSFPNQHRAKDSELEEKKHGSNTRRKTDRDSGCEGRTEGNTRDKEIPAKRQWPFFSVNWKAR